MLLLILLIILSIIADMRLEMNTCAAMVSVDARWEQ